MNRIFIVLILCLFSVQAFAVFEPYVFNHPELEWYTIETEHFKVHYHNGAERTAQIVAKIGEDIYNPITDLYDWEPDGRIHFVIKDYDDDANGGAFYYENKIEILAPQMTFILRGTHNWLRNVVTHEFSHMISLGAIRKMTRKVPAFYFQWINYEREKRPDVLYGYPHQIGSYALPMTIIPMWLAEGMAQYQISGLDYDRWDTHRDMLIRTAIMDDNMHTMTEMGVFGKSSLGNERTYNAGYALTRYIAYNYGEESLKTMTEELRRPLNFSVNSAIKRIAGMSEDELYAQWKVHMKTYYNKRLSVINANLMEGEILVPDGYANIFPVWSPDGETIAYCGSEKSDYLTQTSLLLYDVKSKKSKNIKGGVHGSLAWSKDGNKLLYQKNDIADHGSYIFDLYEYDLITEKETQLTHNLRSLEPVYSPDGKFVVCVVQKDGTNNLIKLELSAQSDEQNIFQELTHYSSGEGITTPHFSPDGEKLVFSQWRDHGRDIVVMDLNTLEITPVVSNLGDARDPVYSPDGEYIYFSWNKSGIHNIYRVKPDGTNPEPVTNVTGGAFMPSVSKDGQIAYSTFKEDGYKLAMIQAPQPLPDENLVYVNATDLAPELSNDIKNDRFADIRNFDDTDVPEYEAEPYSMEYKQMMFMPRVMFDSTRLKIGTYFLADDFLDKYSVLGGVAIDSRQDIDAFVTFEYKKLGPSLFLELYGITRNIQRSIEVIEDLPQKKVVDIQFALLEADIGATHYFFNKIPIDFRYRHQRYTSKIKDFTFRNIRYVSPTNTYFIGNSFLMNIDLDMVMSARNAHINPTSGSKISIEYAYELNDFFEDFATDNEYGSPQEIYTMYKYNRLQVNYHKYLRNPFLKKHAFDLNLIGGWIDRPVDSFFNFFAGGLPGLRGYPFYSIEGRKLAIARLHYRMPVFSNMQKKLFHITTNNMYVGGFVDYGNAFDTDKPSLANFKRDWGFDVRFRGFSFFGYPTAIEYQAAYSMDKFKHEGYTYGKEWRHYVTVLFDFMD